MNRTQLRRTALATTLASVLAVAAIPASADSRHDRDDEDALVRAKVVSADPIYETISEPSTRCWTETVGYAPRRHEYRESNGGAVIGAIAGGLIGSTVGRGNGRIAAAAVGAATGAVVGDRIDHGTPRAYAAGPRQIERCESKDNYRRVISGYDVRYRYQGREYSTLMSYDPGKFVNLRLNWAVVE